ncbi:MAG TPA: DUF1990 domain-containing protein [Pedococcus sp.]|nr:DUF1990 domain-containing protein [Pedococcus sp.]
MRLKDLADLKLTYSPQGRTLDGPLPDGYDHLRVERRIGSGPAAYERAVEAVMTFGAQRGAGLRPQSTAPRAAVGVDLLSRLGPVPVPCRVVWAVQGPIRSGFGYGTLERHVESGEEGFLVELRGAEVYAVVRAYSVPAHWLARAASPVLPRLQGVAALGYVRALRRAVAELHG